MNFFAVAYQRQGEFSTNNVVLKCLHRSLLNSVNSNSTEISDNE